MYLIYFFLLIFFISLFPLKKECLFKKYSLILNVNSFSTVSQVKKNYYLKLRNIKKNNFINKIKYLKNLIAINLIRNNIDDIKIININNNIINNVYNNVYNNITYINNNVYNIISYININNNVYNIISYINNNIISYINNNIISYINNIININLPPLLYLNPIKSLFLLFILNIFPFIYFIMIFPFILFFFSFYYEPYKNYVHRKMVIFNKAYDYLSKNINIEIYNKNNIFELKDDFFTRLSKVYLLKKILFKNKEFYSYWKSIKIGNKEIEEKIKYFLLIIKYEDNKRNRIYKSNDKCNDNININININNINKKKLFCNLCNKSFSSKKTLETHLNSKKHLKNLKENNKESIPYVKESIPCVKEGSLNIKESIPYVKESIPYVKESSLNIKESIPYAKESTLNNKESTLNNSEHKIFRTCAFCKTVFKSRGKLILHIKEVHT